MTEILLRLRARKVPGCKLGKQSWEGVCHASRTWLGYQASLCSRLSERWRSLKRTRGSMGVLRVLREQLALLERELVEPDTYFKVTEDTQVLAQFHTKLSDYHEVADREMPYLHKGATTRCYGEGDRADKTLASLLRSTQSSQYLMEILNDKNQYHYTVSDFIKVRVYNYSLRYSSNLTLSSDPLGDYLDTVQLLQIYDTHRQYLSVPFEEEDLVQAVRSMPRGRPPSPDGRTVQFYKDYAEILALYLMSIFKEARIAVDT
ncbi:hypothetical protein NDU88_003708 [Pleurodeles waltl]|uniref:Uncharacterized protein n=1 Tax=Pleurodeles waltl TaxID=8319 RepID=A0AAV7T5F7_PLEWA|nr:hypothetical protein NDU88_003708 [Pleurodeles waltl]